MSGGLVSHRHEGAQAHAPVSPREGGKMQAGQVLRPVWLLVTAREQDQTGARRKAGEPGTPAFLPPGHRATVLRQLARGYADSSPLSNPMALASKRCQASSPTHLPPVAPRA